MQPKNMAYYDSSELEASAIIKAAPGTLFLMTGVNGAAGTQYIQIHDSNELPAEGAIPVVVFSVATGKSFSYNLQETGRFFKNGITVCNSSTLATKTLGSADCFFSAQYV
jgi:hypothetical protein